jgi:hypothetical protein
MAMIPSLLVPSPLGLKGGGQISLRKSSAMKVAKCVPPVPSCSSENSFVFNSATVFVDTTG